MTAPAVLFLAPRVESEQERAHRVKLASLSGADLHTYAQRVREIADSGVLREPWRLIHVQEEQRRRA